jgi:hypothetical protein
MCSIVCLQMRLPSRAGVFLYLARPAMNDSRRMEKAQELAQTSMRVPGGLSRHAHPYPGSDTPTVMVIHGHAHGHGSVWSCGQRMRGEKRARNGG